MDAHNHPYLQLRSGLTIYPSQSRALEEALRALAGKAPAEYILLADISGQIITMIGDRRRIEDPVSLASLVAGDLAASREIARLLGEYRAYQLVLREGENSHTFIAEGGPYTVLLVQVGADVPLGWARMLIAHTAKQVAEIIDALPEELKTQPDAAAEPLEAEGDMADLFGDALNALWSGDED